MARIWEVGRLIESADSSQAPATLPLYQLSYSKTQPNTHMQSRIVNTVSGSVSGQHDNSYVVHIVHVVVFIVVRAPAGPRWWRRTS